MFKAEQCFVIGIIDDCDDVEMIHPSLPSSDHFSFWLVDFLG